MIRLTAFLGNPGPEYARTRHNIGWLLADHGGYTTEFNWQRKFNSYFTQITVDNNKIYLIMPQTYMNRSGGSVQQAADFFKIKPDEILVVHDEIEIDFGVLSFKKGGGLAGHNGLRSITSSLGTRDFLRFRLGVSKPTHRDISSYVLGKFTPEEQELLPIFLDKAAAALDICLHEGFEAVESVYRKKKVL